MILILYLNIAFALTASKVVLEFIRSLDVSHRVFQMIMTNLTNRLKKHFHVETSYSGNLK